MQRFVSVAQRRRHRQRRGRLFRQVLKDGATVTGRLGARSVPGDHRQARHRCWHCRARVGALAPGRLRAVARSSRRRPCGIARSGRLARAPPWPAHYARHQFRRTRCRRQNSATRRAGKGSPAAAGARSLSPARQAPPSKAGGATATDTTSRQLTTQQAAVTFAQVLKTKKARLLSRRANEQGLPSQPWPPREKT